MRLPPPALAGALGSTCRRLAAFASDQEADILPKAGIRRERADGEPGPAGWPDPTRRRRDRPGKNATTPGLVECAVGAAANARDLASDAEVLSGIPRRARAYALAALAVEEAGKAASLTALAMMPVSLRSRAPIGRMREWHQLKLVGGMLIAAVPFRERTMAAQLAGMAPGQVSRILDTAQALAEDQDRLKQRGLYADIDRRGWVRLPSEVSDADVAAQLARARQAVSAASVLLEPSWPAFVANPLADSVKLCRALVSAFTDAGYGRTPQAAADEWLDAVGKLRQQTTASKVARSGRAGRGT